MSIDEGYIKYSIHWEEVAAHFPTSIGALMQTRDRLHQINLVGHDAVHNVGFGNVSERVNATQFIISGTQTGHLFPAAQNDFTLVTKASTTTNEVWCKGPCKASSESLTHAAIYACSPDIKAILHVHHKEMWKGLLHRVPTSAKDVPYGTVEMANEVKRLYSEGGFAASRIMAMAGHDDGIIAIGKTLAEAQEVLLGYYAPYSDGLS